RQLFKHPLRGQASGFGRNQAPKTDRLNQVPPWEFRNRRKSFTPRQLARILWDFAYLCWANPDKRVPEARLCTRSCSWDSSLTTRGGSPVRESRPPGSVRGASSNGCPYRDRSSLLVEWSANA